MLVEEAIDPDTLDRSDLETRLREARESLDQSEEGSQERVHAERNIARWEAFLEIAGGG